VDGETGRNGPPAPSFAVRVPRPAPEPVIAQPLRGVAKGVLALSSNLELAPSYLAQCMETGGSGRTGPSALSLVVPAHKPEQEPVTAQLHCTEADNVVGPLRKLKNVK